MPGPVATVGSMHVCPMCSGYVPHVGGPITQGETNVLVNGKPVATMGSMCTCAGGPPDTVVQGAPFVFVNGKPVASVGDLTAHGGTITVGEPNVIIGSAVPTPSVTMPRKKIPFPKITFRNRILAAAVGQGENLKKAEENQNKLKNEEKGEPRIYNLQWMKEETVIRESKVLKEVTLKADVYNMEDGDEVTFKVKKPIVGDAGEDGENKEEEIVELSGTVKDKQVVVKWEIEEEEDETQN